MNLAPGELLYGVDTRILKHGMRALKWMFGAGDDVFDAEEFAACLGATVSEAHDVLTQMVAAGCFECTENDQGVRSFKALPPFYRLVAAPISRGLSRVEAETLLHKVKEKAGEINGEPEVYWHRVSRLAVFGSFLSDKEVLGDLDIAYELVRIKEAKEGDLPPMQFFDEADKRRRKAEVALRLRRPNKISLHQFDELDRLSIHYQRLL